MNQLGTETTGQTSKGLADMPIQEIDLVISFGDAHKQYANLPARATIERWPSRPCLPNRSDSEAIREDCDEINNRCSCCSSIAGATVRSVTK